MTKELLENQATHPTAPASTTASVRRTALLVLTALAAVLLAAALLVYQIRRSDPYVQSVLTLDGDPQRGSIIFQQNCAVCHGYKGDGLVGPSLHHVAARKSEIGLIHQVISGETPPMPQFQPDPQAMADLLKYLETL